VSRKGLVSWETFRPSECIEAPARRSRNRAVTFLGVYDPGSAPSRQSRPAPLRAAAHRDAGLSRDIARWRAPPHAGRSDLCRSALRTPSTEKTRPAPIVELARRRRRRQHARYQQPLEVLEPQAGFARAVVDFDPRCAPTPKIGSQHDCLHATTTSALSRCRREDGAGAERAV
jgi:hypothetical protein